MVNLLLNIVWWICGGLASALEYFTAGLIFCITIIGIPLGKQSFKLGMVMLFPFGSEVTPSSRNPIGLLGNILWAIFAGIWIAITHVAIGLLLCITIVGIPWGTKHFKMAKVALSPFGREIIINP